MATKKVKIICHKFTLIFIYIILINRMEKYYKIRIIYKKQNI